ncbi:MAG: adenylate/guanylate cyclase domain-containing protein, partial [Pseudomonadota bacterium]
MSDASIAPPQRRRYFLTQPDDFDIEQNAYTMAALERHKREGLELAVRLRWIAMGVVAVFLVYLNPNPDVLYYHFILALIAANGWLIRRMGRVGQSRIELILIFVDLVIMTFGMVVPNPFANNTWPLAAQYHLDNFQYFFLILAGGTLAYSWRTVIAIGSWTAGLWTATWLIAWWVATPFPELSQNVAQVLAAYPVLIPLSDPTNFVPHLRIQEVLVFVLVAVMLGFSIRRFNRLLMS